MLRQRGNRMRIKDWWKSKPSWLKGGLIWGLIALIIGFLTIRERAYIIPIFIEFFIWGSFIGFITNIKWFKSRAYWLKGGIISVLIILFLFKIVGPSLNYQDLSHEGGPFYEMYNLLWLLTATFVLPFDPLTLRLFYTNGNLEVPGWFSIIYYIYFFAIGALIGWIIGKSKSKQNPPSSQRKNHDL